MRNSVIRGVVIGAAMVLASTCQVWAQSGAELFKTKLCATCHSVGGGKKIGPDLLDVGKRRTEAWLLKFIKSPQAMADSGDATAVALFKEFPVPMADQDLTDDQIRSILEYIASDQAKKDSLAASKPAVPMTEADAELGKKLFQGLQRFENGGPTCTSCHNVKMQKDLVISGGILAAELTNVISTRGGAAGVSDLIKTRPFPVMQQAYANAPLTDKEVHALVAFLEKVDKSEKLAMPLDMGVKLFGAGVIGVILLLGLYSLIWNGRKRESVNQAIFDRQVNSI